MRAYRAWVFYKAHAGEEFVSTYYTWPRHGWASLRVLYLSESYTCILRDMPLPKDPEQGSVPSGRLEGLGPQSRFLDILGVFSIMSAHPR